MACSPAQEFTRRTGSPRGENSHTAAIPACATARPPAASTASPSGPDPPDICTNRPTRASVPSGGQQLAAPDGVGARGGDVEEGLRRVQRDAVRTGHVGEQRLDPPRGTDAEQPAGGVVQPGLPLVGQVEVAAAGKDQVVEAAEALGVAALTHGRDGAAAGVEGRQPALVVGDEDPAVGADLQPVRPEAGRPRPSNPAARDGRRGCGVHAGPAAPICGIRHRTIEHTRLPSSVFHTPSRLYYQVL